MRSRCGLGRCGARGQGWGGTRPAAQVPVLERRGCPCLPSFRADAAQRAPRCPGHCPAPAPIPVQSARLPLKLRRRRVRLFS